MKKVKVNLKDSHYFIYLGYPLKDIGRLLTEKRYGRRILILSDTNVFSIYGKIMKGSLIREEKEVIDVVVRPGEGAKTLNNACDMLKKCAENKMGRDDTILTLGGGVISDLGGFVASIYMRGINFVAVPTTLLAQVDASIGGKTGVNLTFGKNLVGSFYQPSFVYMDYNTLLTLSEREKKQGIAEIIKYGIIKSKKIFDIFVDKPVDEMKKHLPFLIEESIKIKKDVVEKDEKEKKGLREILNFGHTLGHAIEISHLSKFSHGESISLGMAAETYISWKLGFCRKDVYFTVKGVLQKYGLPFNFSSITIDKIFNYLRYDKKVRQGNLRFVLVQNIGKVKSGVVVKIEDVSKILKEMIKNEKYR
ncbi:MAG: 3-dehydroquinate synthase [Candidatus Omnitrophica bacterium]|nr:3-dehydroquinate synthase [Candidatus Omnitrophota bacterium]MCM8776713.1 3-dehydroquinate synthase [Candidatus Omnitrophota bacterium]